MHNGPICQSCSMPLGEAADFGTDELGARVSEYCHHCYREGRFTEPALSIEQMIDRLAEMSGAMDMAPAEARAFAQKTLPKLRRWRASTAGA